MSAAHTQQPQYGDLRLSGWKPGKDKPSLTYVTTTSDPVYDADVMTSCLEFERAVRLRDVRIEPYAVGGLIVVGSNVSLWTLVRGWFQARRNARATIARAKATGQEGGGA